jgi:hypothetical protein
MDEPERQSLEREVREHRDRITQLKTALRDLEENLRQVAGAPPQLARQAAQMKMELRGRSAAFAVGAARLQLDDY